MFSATLNLIVIILQTLFGSSIIYVTENTNFIPFTFALETIFINCTLSYFCKQKLC